MANDSNSRGRSESTAKAEHRLHVEASPKRVRVMFNGKTIADTLAASLMRETGHMPVYYFPRADVRMDLFERSNHKTHCPYKGDASYWTLQVGGRRAENTAWSYETPLPEMATIKGQIAFYWDKVDHWFEEDEEIFGHARDPYHRVDVCPSSREVRVMLASEMLARTRRALFLFETGLPTRYYVPREDVRMDLLVPSATRSICPYKGEASYWSARLGERTVKDIAWAYLAPLPECPRIKDHLCFYPERVDRLDVEGESARG
jgi:uncharacterized protein (DUF427 family)